MKIYNIVPIGKPRMTRSDAWKRRRCVEEYWKFKDAVQRQKVCIPSGGAYIRFYLPMPKSWSAQKLNKMDGQFHTQKPDIDNLLKALLDAVFGSDAHIYDIRVSKYWSRRGMIVVENC